MKSMTQQLKKNLAPLICCWLPLIGDAAPTSAARPDNIYAQESGTRVRSNIETHPSPNESTQPPIIDAERRRTLFGVHLNWCWWSHSQKPSSTPQPTPVTHGSHQ
ncbi:MAG: hypothetical protein IT497_09490 [Ottowia sp.]|nr:hypothetical protein [Ottowia sp.]